MPCEEQDKKLLCHHRKNFIYFPPRISSIQSLEWKFPFFMPLILTPSETAVREYFLFVDKRKREGGEINQVE